MYVIGIITSAAKESVYSEARIGRFSVYSACTLRVLYARKSAAKTGTTTSVYATYGKKVFASEHL